MPLPVAVADLTLDATATLTIRPWPDEVIDAVGLHPCSPYVETFWLGILGPSTTWLLRHLVTTLEAAPDGFELPLTDTARRLGLGERSGRNSPFVRALGRLDRFGLGHFEEACTLAVRMRVPPLTRSQVLRLPELLQAAHAGWQQEQLRGAATSPGLRSAPAGGPTPERDPTPPTPATVEQQRQRARQLALSYLEAGLTTDESERQLLRLGHHPAMCADATRWAVARHEAALAAAAAAAD